MSEAMVRDLTERMRRLEDRVNRLEVRIWLLAFAGSVAGSALGSSGTAMAAAFLGG